MDKRDYVSVFAAAVAVGTALIGGCATHQPAPLQPTPLPFTITVVENPEAVPKGYAGVAHMKYKDGVIYECAVTLRKYPICLAHEVRHCLEGDFHPGRRSTEDCN